MILTREKAVEAARSLVGRWHGDPVLFAREALGVARLWSRQEDLLRAVAAHRKVTVASGQKTAKTFSIAILALWWALTRPKSRVIILAPSARQIRVNVWGELATLRADSYDRTRSPRALLPLGGEWHESPESGWAFPNRSEILGFVSNDPERLRGFSGADQLYIFDEASGVPDPIFQAVDGNLAGGGQLLAISNPVHALGWYGETWSDRSRWHKVRISSIEASNVEPPIRGLATREFIEDKRIEWGESSPEWYAKILGEFPPSSADGVIPRALVDAASKRYRPTPQVDAPLRVGVDVARFGDDKSAIVWRRGDWVSAPLVLEGCDVVEVSDKVLEVVAAQARPYEKVRVMIDAVSVGGGVADILRRHKRPHVERGGECELDVVDVQAAGSSPDPTCSRMRDAIWIGLRKWLADGGTLPPDLDLIADVTAPRLEYDAAGRFKVEEKKSMKRRLGRSTDRADAVALAVHEPKQRNDGAIFATADRTLRRR